MIAAESDVAWQRLTDMYNQADGKGLVIAAGISVGALGH